MKILLIIGLLITTQSIFIYDKIDFIIEKLPEIKEEVYAGRYDKAISKYNNLGLPNDRQWLTQKEWKGKHVKGDTISLFKKWKKNHIQQFIDWISITAVQEVAVYKDIPPSLIVAQAILESNYGMSRISCEANNIFGHKFYGKDSMFIIAADDSPTDKFQVYRSKWWNIRYHSKHLMRKYRKRIVGKPSLNKWLIALCGAKTIDKSKKFVEDGNYVYATSCYVGSECYSQKLKRIINYYNLKKLD